MSSPALWNIISTLSPAISPARYFSEWMRMQMAAMIMLVLMLMMVSIDVIRKNRQANHRCSTQHM